MVFHGTNLDPPTSPAGSSDRVTGWKDVAAHVGKSVRTAQRWEKTDDLPVHRITTPNGEVVYAFRTELNAWLRTRAPKEALPENSAARGERLGTRSRLLVAGLGSAAVIVALLATFMGLRAPVSAPRARLLHVAGNGKGNGPAGWRVADGRLEIYNGQDERLWEYRFPFAIDERLYAKDGGPSLVAIADLENTGGKEVLFVARGKDAADSALLCFDVNGALRFSLQPRRRMRFGDQEYAPPFEVQQIFLTPESNRKYTLWLVAAHHTWFPSVLQKLAHTGDVVAEYWNDGRIDSLHEARVGSRRVILVAGNSIEYGGPSLAVLDYDAPGGSAPADDPRFRCTTCTAGSPLAAFVMPFASMWSELNLAPTVDDILLTPNGYITLALHGSRMAEPGGQARLNVLVTVDQRFDVLDVQATDLAATASVMTKNTAKTGLKRATHLQMFPVLRWLDGRRVPPSSPPM